MRALLEFIEPLSRQDVEDFTAEWYAIQDGEDKEYTQSNGKKVNYKDIYNDSTGKRAAFDDLYDRATIATIKGWPITDEALEVMRQIWLKVGFEGFDGSEAPFKALRAIFKKGKKYPDSDKHLAPLLRMFYGSRDFDDADYERIIKSDQLQLLLAVNDSLYKYPAADLASGLEAIDEVVQENPKGWKEVVFEDGKNASYTSKVKDLRMLASGKSKTRNDTVRVDKMKEKSAEEIAKVAKQIGLDLSKKDDAQLLVDTGNAALKQIASKK